MSFLLDTNVVSEWVKARPDPGVVAWLDNADEDSVFLSVVTFAELRLGVEGATGSRRTQLEAWLTTELTARFEQRVLPVELAVADAWGRCVARCRSRGRPISPMDALMAATAKVHGLTLVTRNVKDFTASGIPVLNPWTAK